MIRLYGRGDRFLGINCETVKEESFINEKLNVKFRDSIWIGRGVNKKQKRVIKVVDFMFVDDDGIYTFFGYLEYLKKLLKIHGMEFVVDEWEFNTSKIVDFEKIKSVFSDYGVLLYDFQVIAVQKALVMKYGTVVIPTGGGKTEVILAITKFINKKTVVVVPTIAIAEQFVERSKIRGMQEVGIMTSNEKREEKITIITANSLHSIIKNGGLIKADVVMFDEFHHVQSDSWKDIFIAFSKSEYMFGFTGTMYRDVDIYGNVSDFTTLGISGRIIVNVSIKHLISEGVITQPVILVVNNFKIKDYGMIKDWNYVKNKLVEDDEYRNGKIVELMGLFEKHGLSTLVSIATKKHAMNILKMLDFETATKSVAVYGGNKGVKYNLGFKNTYIDYGEVAEKLYNGDIHHIVSTSVFDEGVDLPSVNVVILGFSGKSLIKIFQKIGRGVRLDENKEFTFIIDFNDETHLYLQNQYKKRLQYYDNEEIPVIHNLDMEKLLDGGINKSCKEILQGRE